MDPDRIYVSGHSAGGQIVAMLMATNWKGLDKELPVDLVKGASAISGLFDLTPFRLSYLNEVLGLDDTAARRNSPVLLAPSCISPMIVCLGGAGIRGILLAKPRSFRGMVSLGSANYISDTARSRPFLYSGTICFQGGCPYPQGNRTDGNLVHLMSHLFKSATALKMKRP